MSELFLIVTIAGRRIAIRAAEVHSVIELEHVMPVPLAPPFVAGLAALRSKALTVIDCRRSLELERGEEGDRPRIAVVIQMDEFLYALLVDEHQDVVEAASDIAGEDYNFGERWNRVALGMIETDLGAALLVNVAELIAGPPAARAA